MDGSTNVWKALKGACRTQLEAALAPDEVILAWFETDLDARLNYSASVIVLTDRQLMTAALLRDGESRSSSRDESRKSSRDDSLENGAAAPMERQLWKSWPTTPDSQLTAREHNGVGLLDFINSDGRISHWRYTTGRASAAHREHSGTDTTGVTSSSNG